MKRKHVKWVVLVLSMAAAAALFPGAESVEATGERRLDLHVDRGGDVDGRRQAMGRRLRAERPVPDRLPDGLYQVVRPETAR